MASDATNTVPALSVQDLRVDLTVAGETAAVVDGVSFDVDPLETVGLVGESGSGKTVTALSAMGLLAPPLRHGAGDVLVAGDSIVHASERRRQDMRGSTVSMVFQEPMTSLDPAFTILEQVEEAARRHLDVGRAERRRISAEALDAVGIASSNHDRYPHEYSGGMRQRAMIAAALVCRPRLLIADEITTALDVTIQAQILELLRELRREFQMATLLVTHDLGVVADICERVIVMYAGRIVEEAPVEELFHRPLHPYTAGLLSSLPQPGAPGEELTTIPGTPPGPFSMPRGCRFAERCEHSREICRTDFDEIVVDADRRHLCVRAGELALRPGETRSGTITDATSREGGRSSLLSVRGLDVVYRGSWTLRGRQSVFAVQNASFDVEQGETVGLVGESGSGKSTLAHALMGLIPVEAGEIVLDGAHLGALSKRDKRRALAKMQLVFQDPYSSLNPAMTVGDSVAEPLRTHGTLGRAARRDRVAELLETVGLEADHAGRYPYEFSGGQRQRIAIARALSTEPRLLLLDEAVSALDASIRGQIVNLLLQVRSRLGVAMLFIAHDMAVVSHVADRVLVMYAGVIVESGPTTRVFERPAHPYTQALLSAIPVPDPVEQRTRRRIVLEGDPPSRSERWVGCCFASRCPHVMDVCITEEPPVMDVAGGGMAACHLLTGETDLDRGSGELPVRIAR